jgi:acetyl/propionyl-CoA carboxylase alpha subunit
VWGQDREQARHRLLRCLDEYVLEGVAHNIGFQHWLASHPDFAAGKLHTGFIAEHLKPGALDPTRESSEVALFAAALHAREERTRVVLPQPNGGARSPWRWADRRRGSGRGTR